MTKQIIAIFLFCYPAFTQSNLITPATVLPKADLSATGELRFRDKQASPHYVGFKAPATVSANLVWQMMAADGAVGDCLVTNGSGVLSFTSCAIGATCPTCVLTTGAQTITGAKRFNADVALGAGINFDAATSAAIISAAASGGPLNIVGSTSVNGNITLLPGNVAANASVAIVTPRVDQPGLFIQGAAGTTTANVFEIRDSASAVKFKVLGSTDAGCANCVVHGSVYGLSGSTYDLGGSANRWNNLWTVNIDNSGAAGNTINNPNGGIVTGILGVNGLTNASQVRISHTAVDGGLFLTSTTAINGLLSGGASFDGVNWIAKGSGATLIQLGGSFGIGFYTNSGLTNGVNYSPSLRAVMNLAGHLLVGTPTDDGSGASIQTNSFVSSVFGYYSSSSLSNAVNIPNGGVFAVKSAFGTVSNYLALQAASPQIDGGTLNAALNIQGASSTDGRIILTPGAVAGLASVVVQASRTDQPALRVVSAPGTTTGTVFATRDSGGTNRFWILQSGDAACPDCVFSVGHYPTSADTFDLGTSTNRWRKLWLNDIDFNGVFTGTVPDMMSLSTAQAVTGVKDWQANITFGTDNTYSLGTFAKQAFAIYGQAIQSKKFQMQDSGGTNLFWYWNPVINGSTSSLSLVDNAGGTLLTVYRNLSGSAVNRFQPAMHMVPDATATYDLGNSAPSYWRHLYLSGNIVIGGNTVLDNVPNLHVANATGTGGATFDAGFATSGGVVSVGGAVRINATGAGSFSGLTLPAISGSTQCLQVDTAGVVAGSGAGCGGGSVASIATSLPISGGTITTTGTISCPTCFTTDTVQVATAIKQFNARLDVMGSINLGSSPQITAANSGASLQLIGSTTTNGNITLLPGNVAANASVAIVTPRTDQPGLFIQGAAGTTTANVFEIRDSASAVKFKVIGSTDAGCANCVVHGSVFGLAGNTYDLGASSNRWRKLYATDIDFSGVITGSLVTSLVAGTGVSISGATGAVTVSVTGGTGTVTSIATAGPIAGGTITGAGTISCPTCVDTAGGQTITGQKTFQNSNLPITLFAGTGVNSPLIEFRDGAGTPNRWWVGSGVSAANDGTFTVFDALRNQNRLNLPVAGVTQLIGASSSNGNVQLVAGNVAGNSSVHIPATRPDQPGLIITNAGGTTSGSVFEIRDAFGVAKFKIIGSNDSFFSSSNVVVSGTHVGLAGSTYDLGASSNRWAKLWAVNSDISGTVTSYNGSATSGNGLASVGYLSPWTHYFGAIGTTNATFGGTTPPAGLYRITFVGACSSGCGTGQTVDWHLQYNDGVNAYNFQLSLFMSNGSPSFFTELMQLNGGSLPTWSTTTTGGFSASYFSSVTMERIH